MIKVYKSKQTLESQIHSLFEFLVYERYLVIDVSVF